MTPELKLRDGFQIVVGIAVEQRDPMRDEYIISGLQLEKLRSLERLIQAIVDNQAEINRFLSNSSFIQHS